MRVRHLLPSLVAANSGAAYLLLGKLLMPLSFKDEAADAGKKASELGPGLPLARYLVGEYYLVKSERKRVIAWIVSRPHHNPARCGGWSI
jgi:hypothetical protein